MAEVTQRVWKSGPRKVKRTAWGYTYQHDGRQVRKFDAAWSKEDAQNELAAALLKRDAAATPAPPAVKTFTEISKEYVDYKRGKGKRTVDEDDAKLRRLAAFFDGAAPITEITAQRIAQYERDRVAQTSCRKTPVTPATVNRELALLRHMLRLAEEWGYIPRAPKIRMGRESEGRLRFLSEDEAARLLEACAQSKRSPLLHAIVTVALYTGARRGEVLGLSWERVDFARGVLLFDKTKNGRRREVPTNQAVYRVLSALPGEREGLVFRRNDGVAWGSIRTAFEGACAAGKVDDFRFHDLRHTCASWLVMAGRTLKEVQELLGHRSLAMTMRYAHLSPGRLRSAVEALPDVAVSTTSAHSAVESEAVRVTT